MEESTKRSAGMWILWTAIAVVLILIAVFGMKVFRVLTNPASLFDLSGETVQTESEKGPLQPAFPISVEPIESKPEQKSHVGNEDMLNILLMGIDAFEDGSTTSGSMPHTDVMMVIAVNFKTDTVDLITLPRDLFTDVPEHRGYYKLNGVFNVGGGMEDPEGGFRLSCRAAEKWLGGISIPYYYAVDFQAVVQIVDSLGGIDYDVEQPYTTLSNRHIHKGVQHLDGDAVLGYLRIRNESDGLDSSRTARQRKMLVAIFSKLKAEGLLANIPMLIRAADSGIYTNTTLAQTTAIAEYAAKIDPDSIHTRSMYGSIGEIQFYWRFCYVDQENRLSLIRDVYGFDAEPYGVCTKEYEAWLYQIGFQTLKHIAQAEKVLRFAQERKDAGSIFTDEQIKAYQSCYEAYYALICAFHSASDELAGAYTDSSISSSEIEAIENRIKDSLSEKCQAVKTSTLHLCEQTGFQESLVWSTSDKRWYRDTDINEVFVDFG